MLHARFVTFGSLASVAALSLLTNCSPADGPGADSNTGSGSAPPAVGGGGPTGGASNAGGQIGVGGGGPNSGGGPSVGGNGNLGVGGGAGNTGGSGNSNSGGSGNPGSGGGENNGAGGGGPDVDPGGKMNAAPGAMSSEPQDYLRLGEIRILNNNWGSEDLGCFAPTSTMSVFVNQDRTFGWTFSRGDCDTANLNDKPDFPQIEFGVHPFGPGSPLATSPDYSSTLLLPKQIKDISSSSVIVENLQAMMTQTSSWNVTFEFWLSERNPLEANPGVYAELMTFWGWQPNRWPDNGTMPGPTGNHNNEQVESGGKTYKLWVQRDDWAQQPPVWPQGWRYFQFRDNAGASNSFNGTLDVKKFLDYLVNTRGYSPELWVTRLEVGSEIDDMTAGTVTLSGITFEVNGDSRSEVIAP